MSTSSPSPSATPTPTETKTAIDYYNQSKTSTNNGTVDTTAQGSGQSQGGSPGIAGPEDGILWIESIQTPMGFQSGTRKTKTEAKAALKAGQLTSIQQSIVDRGYAAFKAGGGSGSKSSWFEAFINSSNTSTSPFQLINQEYNLGATPSSFVPGASTLETGTGLTKAEKAALKELKIMQSALSQDPEADLTGTAGQLQDTLTKYVDSMGLLKSRKEVNSYVKSIMEGTVPEATATDEMRKQAKILYSNFADRLDADPTLTVRDLVNPYLQVMADTLEIDPNMVKITDPTIQNAISGTKLRSLTDFRNDMRNDSRFATTRTARREATDLAQSLLKGFGFSI